MENLNINKFSAPMPFMTEHIELLAKINERHSASKITMLYNCLPANAIDCSGFEQLRCHDDRIKSLNDLIPLVQLSRSLGMDFTYLLNSVNTPHPDIFRKEQWRFRNFLEQLLENGITKLRISNTQIADYVMQNYPHFTIYSSTSQEYYSLKQYANLFNHFTEMKEVVPTWDINKNFTFIKNFKLRFPDKILELMVNEGCIGGCPFRRDHHASNVKYHAADKHDRFTHFFSSSCSALSDRDKALYICLSNIIYPWEISTYNKYGIYNFKLIGRNSPDFRYDTKYLERFDSYLSGIENPDSIMDAPFIDFNHYLIFYQPLKNLKVKDIIEFLPKIEHFEKNGHLCASICGASCHYCYDCAKKMWTEFEKWRK